MVEEWIEALMKTLLIVRLSGAARAASSSSAIMTSTVPIVPPAS